MFLLINLFIHSLGEKLTNLASFLIHIEVGQGPEQLKTLAPVVRINTMMVTGSLYTTLYFCFKYD